MAYSISNLKSDLAGILHGTTVNQVTGIDNLIDRAARQVLLDCDPQETKRIQQFANPIFNQVYDYALPTDVKGNRIIDIRPQTPRTQTQVWSQRYNQYFDINKLTALANSFTLNFDTASKTVRINSPSLPAGDTVNNASSITNNGTWAVDSVVATTLTEDDQNYISGGSSLKFNLASGANPSTGYIENSTMTSVDLTDYLNVGTIFLYVYLPTGTDFTSITLRWGSSASAYWSLSATTAADGTAFQNGWNLCSFTWSSASQTGTPDESAIDYLRVSYTYNGTAQTAVRLNNIVARLGSILEIEYYSKFMFRSSAGAFQETVTADTNLINLDTESYNLLLYQVCIQLVQQTQGADALQYDSNYFTQMYERALQRYTGMYKSEVQKPQSIYYRLPKPTQQGWRIRRGF